MLKSRRIFIAIVMAFACLGAATPSRAGEMLRSDKDPALSINAWGGAKHGAELRLHNGCTPANPDCTWTFRNGMIVSDRDPTLAINAWNGAQHGTQLRLFKGCTPTNPDCTWTYRRGRLVSDRDPSLAINAWGGAQHGAELRLHNACALDNPDCTWSIFRYVTSGPPVAGTCKCRVPDPGGRPPSKLLTKRVCGTEACNSWCLTEADGQVVSYTPTGGTCP
jgi:hypothetical protein